MILSSPCKQKFDSYFGISEVPTQVLRSSEEVKGIVCQ